VSASDGLSAVASPVWPSIIITANYNNGICQMLKKTRMHEQRKHARYWVHRGSVAVPRSFSANIGRIIDISRNGIAVRYKSGHDWLKGASQIDIMLIDDDFYLSKLSAEIISDETYLFCDSGKKNEEKRCGLQFTNLSNYQLTEIDQFIHKFSTGKVWSYQTILLSTY